MSGVGEKFAAHVWPDMVEVYGRDGVAPLCLQLQDSHDVDVPLLLVLVLAEAASATVADRDLAELVESAGPWRETVVRPLREMRRRLKAQALLPEDREFREAVKRLELQAERRHVERLAQGIARLPRGRGAMARAYLDLCGVENREATAALDTLHAALDWAEPHPSNEKTEP